MWNEYEFKREKPKITFYSALIPKGTGMMLLTDPKNMEVLNFIEVRAMCMIKFSDVIDSDNVKNTVYSKTNTFGWWKLEIYYHQRLGDHNKCMSLLNKLIRTFRLSTKISIRLLPIKTLYGYFDVPEEIKKFLESGSIRKNMRYNIDDLIPKEKPVVSDRNPKGRHSRNSINLSSDSVDESCEYQMWVSDDWNSTWEEIIKASLFITRQFLNPKYYSTLPSLLRPLNIVSLVREIAVEVLESELSSSISD